MPPADSARDPPTTLPGETRRGRSTPVPNNWHRPETRRPDCSRSGCRATVLALYPGGMAAFFRKPVSSDDQDAFRIRQRMDHPEPALHPSAPRPHPIEHGPVSAGIHGMGLTLCFPPTANNCVVPPHPATPGDTPPAIRASRTVSRNHPVPRPTRPRAFQSLASPSPFILPRFTHHQPRSRQTIQMKYKLVLSTIVVLVSAPNLAPSEIMRRIKGAHIERSVRRVSLFEEFPYIKKQYRGVTFGYGDISVPQWAR